MSIRGMTDTAPVPSPRAMPSFSRGDSPSSSITYPAPGSADRWEAVRASRTAGHSRTAARAATVEMNPSITAGVLWRAQPI